MDGLARELPLSETQYLIMASLIEPAHGYAIMQHIEQVTGSNVAVGPGTMYGTLKKLLRKALIRQVAAAGGDERRITYMLTDDGRRLLELEIERLEMLAAIGRGKIEEMRSGTNG